MASFHTGYSAVLLYKRASEQSIEQSCSNGILTEYFGLVDDTRNTQLGFFEGYFVFPTLSEDQLASIWPGDVF